MQRTSTAVYLDESAEGRSGEVTVLNPEDAPTDQPEVVSSPPSFQTSTPQQHFLGEEPSPSPPALGTEPASPHSKLVHSFRPTEGIEWESISMAKVHVLGTYVTAVVEEEFLRFMFRDCLLIAFSAACAFYCFAFPWVLGFLDHWHSYVMYVCGACSVALCVFDGVVFFTMERTGAAARRRECASLAFQFVVINCCTWVMPHVFASCEKAPDILFWLIGERPALSADRKQQYCLQIINPFAVVCQLLVIVVIRMRRLPTIALSLIAVAAQFLGNLEAPADDNETLAGRIVIHLAVFSSALALAVVRDRRLRAQFEQAVGVVVSSRQLQRRQDALDKLLCAMMPPSVLHRLMASSPVADSNPTATIFFSDIVQFTRWSSNRSAEDVVFMLNTLCVGFDKAATELNVEKVKTIGDAYWAVCGVPEPRLDHADSICLFGLHCLSIVDAANLANPLWGGLEIRIGVHTGHIAGGILGSNQMSYEVFGEANTVAEHVEQAGVPGEICATVSTVDCLSPDLFQVVPHVPLHVAGYKDGLESYLIRPLGRARARQRASISCSVSNSASQQSTSMSLRSGEDLARQRARRQRFLQRQLQLQLQRRQPTRRSSDNDDEGKAAEKPPTRKDAFGDNADAEGADEHAAGEEVTALEVISRILRRRYRFGLLTFADAPLENDYHEFARNQQRQLRIASRATSLVLVSAVVASTWIQGAMFTERLSASLLSLAWFLALLALVAGILWCLLPAAEIALTGVVCVSILLGSGLHVSSAVACNDVTYLVPALATTVAVGFNCFPALGLSFLYLVAILVPAIAVVLPTHYRASSMLFMVLVTIVVFAAAYLSELMLRRQFAESYACAKNNESMMKQRVLQERLLASIVPEHVVKALMLWFEGGQDLKRSISQAKEVAAVGFFQFHPLNLRSTPTQTPRVENVWTEQQGQQRNPEQMMDYIRDLQRQMEVFLSCFSAAVTKIKTIGDITLVAGPFADGIPVADACDALVQVALNMRRAFTTSAIRCGLHAGPIVGAVLGTERLAFDIFGDTVNTAARTMTSGTRVGTIFATSDFVAQFPTDVLSTACSPSRFTDNLALATILFHFGPSFQENAKGKGTLIIHEVMEE